MITGPAFENISWRTYISEYIRQFHVGQLIYHLIIVFACLNAAIIPAVYVFFPGKLIIPRSEWRA